MVTEEQAENTRTGALVVVKPDGKCGLAEGRAQELFAQH